MSRVVPLRRTWPVTVWITADQHFGHANIINLCNRPFLDVHEMDEELIRRWNIVVKPGDEVYVVGDFTLGRARSAEQYVRRLAGKIAFVPGSHDKWMREAVSRYEGDFWDQYPFLGYIHAFKELGHHIVLCHYAMRSWPDSMRGSFQLYGHSHGRLEKTRQPRQMDVGVDCHHFYPVRLDQAIGILSADADREPLD